jgi:hypothetical protein
MSGKHTFLVELMTLIGMEVTSLPLRNENQYFVREITEGVTGVVGFGVATHRSDGRVGVNPVIGVSFGTIEDRIGAWTEEKLDDYISMTISSPLGYITPEKRFLEWLFEPGFDNASEVRRMVRAIREYGLPFMKSYSELDSITEALESKRFTINQSRAYRLPIAYLLQGKTDLANLAVNKEVIALGDRTDAAARNYRRFARRFLTEMLGNTERPADRPS